MLSIDKQIENFDNIGKNPLAWRMKAQDLSEASNVFYSKIKQLNPLHMRRKNGKMPKSLRFISQMQMLRAMALECLLKGILIKHGNKLVLNGKYIKVKGAGEHDLVQLANICQFKLKNDEKDYLMRLSIFHSLGRYPVPSNVDKVKIRKLFWGGKGFPAQWTSFDVHLFRRIYARLNKLFNKRKD